MTVFYIIRIIYNIVISKIEKNQILTNEDINESFRSLSNFETIYRTI